MFLSNILLVNINLLTDGLVRKLEELEKVADMYKGLIEHTKSLLKTTFELSQSHKGKVAHMKV